MRGDSRSAIIEAAIEVFAQKGVYGSRVDEIVTSAGLNVRMIYHHFGSKEGLYDHTLQTLVSRRNKICGWHEPSHSPANLDEELEKFCVFACSTPSYGKVLAWEAAAGWNSLQRVVEKDKFFPPKIAALFPKEIADPAWAAINLVNPFMVAPPYEDLKLASQEQQVMEVRSRVMALAKI